MTHQKLVFNDPFLPNHRSYGALTYQSLSDYSSQPTNSFSNTTPRSIQKSISVNREYNKNDLRQKLNQSIRLHPLYASRPHYIDFNKTFIHFSEELRKNGWESHLSNEEFSQMIPLAFKIPCHVDDQKESSSLQDLNKNKQESLYNNDKRQITSHLDQGEGLQSSQLFNNMNINYEKKNQNINHIADSRLKSLIHSQLQTKLPFLRYEGNILWNMSEQLKNAMDYVHNNLSSIQFLSSTEKIKHSESPLIIFKDSILLKCINFRKYPMEITSRVQSLNKIHINSEINVKNNLESSRLSNQISQIIFKKILFLDDTSISNNPHYVDRKNRKILYQTVQKLFSHQQEILPSENKLENNSDDSIHKNLLTWLTRIGVNAIITKLPFIQSFYIDNLLMKEGIICITNITKSVFERLKNIFGGITIPSLEYLREYYIDLDEQNPNFDLKLEDLFGKCSDICISQLGRSYYYHLYPIVQRKSLVLIVNSSHSYEMKDKIMSAVDTSLNCLNLAAKDKYLLPGGGSFEMILSSYFRKIAQQENVLSLAKKHALLQLSVALEIIPKAILESYSVSSQEIIVLWRKEIDNQIDNFFKGEQVNFIIPDFNNIRNRISFINILEQDDSNKIFDLMTVKLNIYQNAIIFVNKIKEIGYIMHLDNTYSHKEETEIWKDGQAQLYEESGSDIHQSSISDAYHRHNVKFPKNQQWIQHARTLEIKSQR